MKRWFIVLFLVAATFIAVFALYNLIVYGFDWAWVGTAVATLPILFYFGNLYRYHTPRTTRRLDGITALIGIGTVITMGTVLLAGNGRSLWPPILSLLMLGGWRLYTHWYSNLDRPQNDLLIVGQPLPPFTLQNENGHEIHTQSFHGNPALMMFYRGNWCPFCIAQIRELVDAYQELAHRGVQIAFISPQPQDETQKLAQQFNVPLQFLVDKENHVARQLNIAHPAGVPGGLEILGYAAETVYPTVIITNAQGQIIFAEQTDNYRLRPEPQTFFHILDTA